MNGVNGAKLAIEVIYKFSGTSLGLAGILFFFQAITFVVVVTNHAIKFC